MLFFVRAKDGEVVAVDDIILDVITNATDDQPSIYDNEYKSILNDTTELSPSIAVFLLSLVGVTFTDVPSSYPFFYSRKGVKIDTSNLLTPYDNNVIVRMLVSVCNYAPINVLIDNANALRYLLGKQKCSEFVSRDRLKFITDHITNSNYDGSDMWIMYDIITSCHDLAYACLVSSAMIGYAMAYEPSVLDSNCVDHAHISAVCLSWYMFPYYLIYDGRPWSPNNRTHVWCSEKKRNTQMILTEHRKDIIQLIASLVCSKWIRDSQYAMINSINVAGHQATIFKVDEMLTTLNDPFKRPATFTAFANGVIIGGGKTLTIRPIRTADMITQTSNTIVMDDKLPCNDIGYTHKDKYDQYVQRMFPNPMMREMMFRLIASSFFGANRDKVIVVCHGIRGDEGKSYFASILEEMYGCYAVAAAANMLTGVENKDANTHTSYLDGMCDAKAVIQNEGADSTSTWNTTLAKRISGNDTMRHRNAYSKTSLRIKFPGIYWFISNTLPKMPFDITASDYNRFLFLVFGAKFVSNSDLVDEKNYIYLIDPELDTFKTEIAGWLLVDAIAAYPRFIESGYHTDVTNKSIPHKSLMSRNRYIETTNPYLLAFMQTLWMVYQRDVNEYNVSYPSTHKAAAIAMMGKTIRITANELPLIVVRMQQSLGVRAQEYVVWERVKKQFITLCEIYKLPAIQPDSDTMDITMVPGYFM